MEEVKVAADFVGDSVEASREIDSMPAVSGLKEAASEVGNVVADLVPEDVTQNVSLESEVSHITLRKFRALYLWN